MVLFLHNVPNPSRKDDMLIELYVKEGLCAHDKSVEFASMAFREDELYPLDEGTNAKSLHELVAFVSRLRPT